jgi:hypothetical protein
MDKNLYKILILLVLVIISCCDSDCNPLECAIKNSIDLLNKDRDTINSLQAKMDSFQAFIIKLLDDSISTIKIDVYNKLRDFSSQTNLNINALIESLTSPFLNLKNDLDILKNSLANNLVNSENKNHMYKDSLIYQNIVNAYNTGIVVKSGDPYGWDETTYRTNLWNGRVMMCFGWGSPPNDFTGMKTTIPQGYDVLWIRANSDNNLWFVYKIAYLDDSKEILPKFATGLRGLVEISPEGGAPDSYNKLHLWTPIPVPRPGSILIQSNFNSLHWISGIAFGKNLWGHAKNSAYAYFSNINPGTEIKWDKNDFNGDING